MKYSLANYIVTLKLNDSELQSMFGEITIGGEGDTTGTITLSRDSALYDVNGYATGGYVFSKNLNKTGSITITINQLSNKVDKLKKLCNVLASGDYDGLTITLDDSNANQIASCIDCYPEKIVDQSFGSTADNQTWKFLVGQLNIN